MPEQKDEPPKVRRTLSDAPCKPLTAEQQAISKEMGEKASKAIIKGLAQDNLKIFGTPIPDELKD